jgi:peptidoglycan/xylan/chitin deacetylase (PgdA/CDA1 family)
VVLSHDLDSTEGVTNCLRHFAPLEEAVGARALNFIVPCGFPVDQRLLEELRARGHELGIHGFDHANKTPFAAPDVRKERLHAAARLVEQFEIRGYRAPSLLRTQPLLQDLSKIYEFDSSIPTSGGLFPVPNNGCATARPFQIEGIWELPLSVPRDGSLRFLGESPGEILELWKTCSLRIAKSGGVVVLLTHCEQRFSGNPHMLQIYQEFVEFVATSPEFVWSNATEVLAVAKSVRSQSRQAS